jgi:hypothetical protein
MTRRAILRPEFPGWLDRFGMVFAPFPQISDRLMR